MNTLRFDRPVAPDGYAWWYVDALSDDGRHGITLIAFLGSVFSPWYALARRRGPADPLNHACLNVSLYGAPRRWAMTDRPRSAVERDATHLAIGPSSLEWDGEALTIRIDEVTAPIPSRLRGTVRVIPGALNRRVFELDAAGRHRWSPIAAVARVEVALESPALRWSGAAYFDTNEGDAPLERDFVEWDWCRAPGPEGTAILYEATRRDGTTQCLALRAPPSGDVEEVEAPPRATLPPTRIWRIPRATRVGKGGAARVTQTLEDTPFYSRSVLSTRLLGTDRSAVHESLLLDRFRLPVVQAMLAFRVPRARR
ncbi:carotenoid 1,2-hydratase [Roseomonas nepalensis]|uniref:Carotenoid 1,2-hydratase n=1 Tax=Muricoccus nepalensis TaxID=1854500 RepID=A0A502GAA1_9PROT|nr:carotenoid 1,2-hydratase [Roseomonas nepalensis]TPG58562.1 carotenoid 1,2-hydratase [Roseomonas nepalensis]